jgi:hypothetical protein
MPDMNYGGFTEQAPANATTFVGLEGRSQKAGYRVIFPTLDMSRYLEISEEDILAAEELPAGQSPFGALGGTRLSVRAAAQVTTNRTSAGAQEMDDEFDLDIRLGASGWSTPDDVGAWSEPYAFAAPKGGGGAEGGPIQTNGACPPTVSPTCKTCVTCETCQTRCNQKTCETCATCKGENTCQTCQTKCEQHTCATCKGENTCQTCQTCNTQCGQNTCATCKGENTCQTCETRCQQKTCVTCQTCAEKGCPVHTQTCCKDTCF